MTMTVFAYALGIVALLSAGEGLMILMRRNADPVRVKERLGRIASQISATPRASHESLLREEVRRLGFEWGALDVMLYRAGAPMTIARFVVVSALLAATAFVAVMALTGSPVRAVPALVVGVVPWVVVSRKARKRMNLFDEQLPDGIELLTRSLRAGHALGSGFQMVGQELADPIGPEFQLVADEIRLGLEVRDALENMMRRVDNPDLPYFTTAVLIQRQTGGNLAELLDKLGSLLRERQQFSGRVRALTAQGRGAATILALWMPFIVGVIWVVAPEPGYIQPLLQESWGQMVLAAAAAIDVLAYFMAVRIADVQA